MGIFQRTSSLVFVLLLTSQLLAEPKSREIVDPRPVKLLENELQILEAQVQLYKLQHGDAWPDFANWQWKPLRVATDAQGHFDPQGRCGPYIKSLPINPFNRFSDVMVMEHPSPGSKVDRERVGFVFDPRHGFFWATDSSGEQLLDRNLRKVFPGAFEFQPATSASDRESRKEDLWKSVSLLRGAVMMYKLQHNGSNPDLARYPNWEQLTMATNADGQVLPDGCFGPYLADVPMNPLTGFRKAERVQLPPFEGYKTSMPEAGYVLAVSDGTIRAVDDTGAVVFEPRAAQIPIDPAASELRDLMQSAEMEQLRGLHVTLSTIQPAVAYWRSEHAGAVPDFQRYPQWEQFLNGTDDTGNPNVQGVHTRLFATAPQNRLNGATAVFVVNQRPMPGMRLPRRGYGFVFCIDDRTFWPTDRTTESVMTPDLRAIYPKAFDMTGFAEAPLTVRSERAKLGSVQVSALRRALQLYRQDHEGRLPDLVKYPNWEQLINCTNSEGNPAPLAAFGPYLMAAPINLTNGSSHVCVVNGITTQPYTPPEANSGYVLDLKTRTLLATNSRWRITNPPLSPATSATAGVRDVDRP